MVCKSGNVRSRALTRGTELFLPGVSGGGGGGGAPQESKGEV